VLLTASIGKLVALFTENESTVLFGLLVDFRMVQTLAMCIEFPIAVACFVVPLSPKLTLFSNIFRIFMLTASSALWLSGEPECNC